MAQASVNEGEKSNPLTENAANSCRKYGLPHFSKYCQKDKAILFEGKNFPACPLPSKNLVILDGAYIYQLKIRAATLLGLEVRCPDVSPLCSDHYTMMKCSHLKGYDLTHISNFAFQKFLGPQIKNKINC